MVSAEPADLGQHRKESEMKVLFVWPDCPLGSDNGSITSVSWRCPKVDCYYVEAKYGGAIFLVDQAKELKIVSEDQWLAARDDPEDHKEYYFLIAKDLSRMIQLFWVWPYSGMNCSKEHFKWVKPVELDNLEELKSLVLEFYEGEDD